MTTRTAAEALEKLIRLERDLEKKCHDLGYYTMIHVGLREFVAHADTLRAALAPLQEGEVELAAEQMDWTQVVLNGGPPCFHFENGRFCGRAERWGGHDEFHPFVSLARLLRATQAQPLTDAQIVEIRDDHLPSQGEPFDCLAFARAVLRATQSNGHSPTQGHPEGAAAKVGHDGNRPTLPVGESPAPSAPAQEPVSAALRVFAAKNPLAAPQPPPAQEREAKVSQLLDRALTTGYGSTEAIYALANLARESLSATAPAQEPVAWRIKDFADGWILVHTWPEAMAEAESAGNTIQPLYAAPPPDEAREIIADLVAQIDKFAEEQGEADFYTGKARAFLARHK